MMVMRSGLCFLSSCCVENGSPEGQLFEWSGQEMTWLYPLSNNGDRNRSEYIVEGDSGS